MVDLHGKTFCYHVLQTEKDKDDYIACMAIENEPGYYRMDWRWGNDFKLAEECAISINKRMDISEEQAFKIVLSSMQGVN